MSKLNTVVNANIEEAKVSLVASAQIEVYYAEQAGESIAEGLAAIEKLNKPGNREIREHAKVIAAEKAAALEEELESKRLEIIANNASIKIWDKKQVDNMRKLFIEKDKSILFRNIKIVGKSTFEVSILRAQSNLSTNLLALEDCCLAKSGPNTVRQFVNEFTKDIINIDFSDYTGDEKDIEKFSGNLYIVGNGMNEKVYLERLDQDTLWDVAQNERKSVSKSVLFEKDGVTLRHDVVSYSGKGRSDFSVAQGRKDTISFFRNDQPERIKDILNAVLFGAFELLDGKAMDKTGLVTTTARFGQYKSPSSFQNSLVNTLALYCGKWEDDNGGSALDGSGYLAEPCMINALNEKSEKYVFLKSTLIGLLVQQRPWMSKVQSIVIEKALMSEKAGQYEVVFIDRNNFTDDDQKHFNILFDKENRKKSKFYGKLLLVSNDIATIDQIDFMTDLNGMKSTFDLSKESGLNILDVGKSVEDAENAVSGSTQMFQSILYADPVAGREYIEKKGMEHVNNKLATMGLKYSKIDGKNTLEFIGKEDYVTSIADYENLFIPMVAPALSIDFVVNKHAAMYRSSVDNLLKGIIADISGMSFGLDGANVKIIPDQCMLFNRMVIKAGEVVCVAAEEYFTKKGMDRSEWYVALFKYPKMHVREFGCDKIVTIAEILERIAASDMTDSQKWLMRRLYKSLRSSTIVVPAIEINKKKLAGMDYDADALVAVFDKEFVNILKKLNPLAVNIDNSGMAAVDATKFRYDGLTSWRVFKNMVTNGAKSIGEISIDNDVVVMFLISLLLGKNVNAIQYVMEKVFVGEHIVEEYISPVGKEDVSKEDMLTLVQTMSQDIGREVVESTKDMALSVDNMIMALLDLNMVCRMYQETTIDSAKTYVFAEIMFEMTKQVRLLSRTNLDLEIVWPNLDESNVTTKEHKPRKGWLTTANKYLDYKKSDVTGPGVYDIEKEKIDKKFRFMDEFQEIRLVLAKEVGRIALQLRAKKQEFSPIEAAYIKEVAGDHRVGDDKYKAIIEAKKAYNDVTGHARLEKMGADDEYRKVLNAKYEVTLGHIANHVRALTLDLSPVERARLVIDAGGNSNFAFAVFPQEFLLFIAETFAEVKFAGERLSKCDFEIGEEVLFYGGLASVGKKTARTKADISGRFTIREFNGKKYASKLISELVIVPEINTESYILRTHSSEQRNIAKLQSKLTVGTKVSVETYDADCANKDLFYIDGQAVKYTRESNTEGKLYEFSEGVVSECVAGPSKDNKGNDIMVMIVVVDNVVKLPIPENKVAYGVKKRAAAKANTIVTEEGTKGAMSRNPFANAAATKTATAKASGNTNTDSVMAKNTFTGGQI